MLVFPEVVFAGGSLAPTGLNEVVDRTAAKHVDLFPNPEGRQPEQGTVDVGARAWQLEPATKFMNRAIYGGEDPSWNPYSAGGMLGPETLADMKLSPLVVATAVLGGSSPAFTLVMLLLLVIALYCLQQLFSRSMAMHWLAGLSACIVFLLGGWAAAMLTSQMGAPYVLFPVVLYALVEFLRGPKPLRFLLAIAAYAALFLTTFLPVVLLMMVFVHSVALVIDASQRREMDGGRSIVSRVGILLGRQVVVPGAAVAVTAFMWLPTIDAYRHSGDDIARYSGRMLTSKDPIEFLSLLTPRHIYRPYISATIPERLRDHDVTVFLGIVPLILMTGALPRSRDLARRLLVVMLLLVLVAVAQHMAVPGLSAIGGLPGLRTISGVYWAALAGAATTVGVGLAVHTALRSGLDWKAAAATGGLMVAALAVGVVTNWRVSNVALASIAAACVLIGAMVAIATFARGDQRRLTVTTSLAVGLLALELLSYQNHARVKRVDYEDHPPAYLTFVKENVGDGRVLNAGRSGLYAEWGSALGIRQIETLNVMQIPEYRTFFFNYLNEDESRGKFLRIGGDPGIDFGADPAALDQMAVRYILVADELKRYGDAVATNYPLVFDDREAGVRVFENTDAFPRAYLSPALVPASAISSDPPPWQRSRAFTTDANFLDEARAAGVSTRVDGSAAGEATIVEDHNTRVTVDVDASQPSVLVLADVYHDNWSVTVNGEPADLAEVNDVARGVVVPAGGSTVEFRYESRARTIGALISLVAVVALLVGSVVWSVRRRRTIANGRQLNEAVGSQGGVAAPS